MLGVDHRTPRETYRYIAGVVPRTATPCLGRSPSTDLLCRPFINGGKEYAAHFAEAGGLAAGNPVEVSGARVGQVSGVALDGAQVLVTFKIDGHIHVGDRS